MKVEHILWPTDLSALSQKAMPFVNEMARRFSASVDVIHVVPNPPTGVVPAGAPEAAGAALASFSNRMQTSSDEALQDLAASGISDQVEVRWHTLNGNPACAIADYAREQGIDLIVLCTHGTTGLVRLVSGSVAERVVRLSPCPVLVVPSADPG